MDFLHKETSASIEVLQQNGEKSSFVAGNNIEGHLKPYSLEDSTFDVSGISGSLYKLTLRNGLIDIPDIKEGYKLTILGDLFVVKAVKTYAGITFETKKILLVKENKNES